MIHFKSISAFHAFRGLPKPEHPLFSIINVNDVKHLHQDEPTSLVFHFYGIALKRVSGLKVKYGQQDFDFNEGVMSFSAPNQVFSLSKEKEGEIKQSGWVMYIHPDFLWNTPLATTIRQYAFWEYALHEALFLSEKEEAIIVNIIRNIEQEYHSNIDKYSRQIIISQLEGLISYAERFYNRQFITREKSAHQIVGRLETLLTDYFNSNDVVEKGLPTVQFIADALHISPKYLSTLLSVQTGMSAQQHIHEKLIERAKEKLSATQLSVNEIAYELGFEHPQSFSKLFKSKTSQSPLEFRAKFQ